MGGDHHIFLGIITWDNVSTHIKGVILCYCTDGTSCSAAGQNIIILKCNKLEATEYAFNCQIKH